MPLLKGIHLAQGLDLVSQNAEVFAAISSRLYDDNDSACELEQDDEIPKREEKLRDMTETLFGRGIIEQLLCSEYENQPRLRQIAWNMVQARLGDAYRLDPPYWGNLNPHQHVSLQADVHELIDKSLKLIIHPLKDGRTPAHESERHEGLIQYTTKPRNRAGVDDSSRDCAICVFIGSVNAILSEKMMSSSDLVQRILYCCQPALALSRYWRESNKCTITEQVISAVNHGARVDKLISELKNIAAIQACKKSGDPRHCYELVQLYTDFEVLEDKLEQERRELMRKMDKFAAMMELLG